MTTDHDERVIATRQRWGTCGMVIFTIALSIDLLVRTLILKQEPRQWLDIAAIWMGTAVFVSIGMTASGVQLYGGKLSRHWPVILTIVVVNAVVLSLMGRLSGLADSIGFIAGVAGGVFVVLVILRVVYNVWERRTLGRRSP